MKRECDRVSGALKNIEILAPAGDEASARVALQSGADAVYLGLTRFSARSGAENFEEEALSRIVRYAHMLGGKVYVCLNTLVKDSERKEFIDTVKRVYALGADAVLLQDLFLGKRLKESFPALTLHLSTQAGCCNELGARLAKEAGFSRVVLARETSLEDISLISKIIETEVFVQGALCTCFSGQCYLSSFIGNNSGNRGRCKQPCRKRYSIDREGYSKLSYALSPSDLCVGARLKELISAGAVSLKIEGRLRRPEYIASAVRYYRALLAGEPTERAFSDLKRSFNRGDYTEGLAFGQNNFLSRRVQGHIGECVGFLDAALVCRSKDEAQKGDGFKILRDGIEVGGARFRERAEGGFRLSSSEELKEGDEVRLTTDVSLAARAGGEKRRKISLSIHAEGGKPIEIECGGFRFAGRETFVAERAPLSEREVMECFRKTDALPFEVEFEKIELSNGFLPKSALNAVRRAFFDALATKLDPPSEPLRGEWKERLLPLVPTQKSAVIARCLRGKRADILIYKSEDYSNIRPEDVEEGEGEKFLYLPPYFTGREIEAIEKELPLFAGIYCDGIYGLALARKRGMKFFAGTGFNLTNRIALDEVKRMGADYFALSKELSAAEQEALCAEGAFVLYGAVKVMDLCYCPFEKTCSRCDRRGRYTLKDEEGRAFPLLRYKASSCRFELYNCAPLLRAETHAGTLLDLSVEIDAPATKGHTQRSML